MTFSTCPLYPAVTFGVSVARGGQEIGFSQRFLFFCRARLDSGYMFRLSALPFLETRTQVQVWGGADAWDLSRSVWLP